MIKNEYSVQDAVTIAVDQMQERVCITYEIIYTIQIRARLCITSTPEWQEGVGNKTAITDLDNSVVFDLESLILV